MLRLTLIGIWTMLCLIFIPNALAQDYQKPSPALQQTIAHNAALTTRLSNDHQWLALLSPIAAPSIATLAQPEQKLAGLRIAAEQYLPSRITQRYHQLKLISIQDNRQRLISLPGGHDITELQFSPDSRYLSYVSLTPEGGYLYVYDIAQNRHKRLSDNRLNGTISLDYQWANNNSLLARFVIASNTNASMAPTLYAPKTKETSGKQSPQRTYQDLLKTSADKQRFSQLTTSQLALVDMDGKLTNIAAPGIFEDFSLSPDGQYILTHQLTTPFSTQVKYYDFPILTEIYNLDGQRITQLHQSQSGESKPQGRDSVLPGPRMFHWVQGQGATLAFTEALDQGDSQQEAPLRDSLWQLDAPFTQKAKLIAKTPWRIIDIDWAENNIALVSQRNSKAQLLRLSRLDPHLGESSLYTLNERNLRDKYQELGKFPREYTQGKGLVIRVQQAQTAGVIHNGQGASPQGDKPFLKRTSLATGESSLLWQSATNQLESVRYVLNLEPLQLIINRESPTEAPSLVLIDGAKERVLYQQADELSAYRGMRKQLITYKRADGVPLSGTLYLPANYTKEQGTLPVLMWAYPREFNDPDVAGQISFSANQYPSISPRGPIPLVAEGFAVFDKVSMPIIAQGDKEPNDSFREQLVANAQAAVDTLVDLGIADRKQIAVGGHSYGAFMVANLLAHTDLFYAGIARSGAYNRSLTPFGFQNEERYYWQANDIYQQMSPFNYADNIKSPLLLVHGEMDQNSGTFPLQSERLFDAIQGLGGKARLVILPFEGHGYAAKESLEHLLWEQSQFLKANLPSTNL
ncbi:glutamyl peptidase. Serine peptidase. MEROPS family S09D [Shewanella sp. ANA-3]|uniref:S9 family peptidase n=1 Tax=Shewanella sp. (strain ANA-3) TaxID=94122 RepID=UPI00005DF82F|nr:prolyl oligopeptidase family serine peptidase [Shewanella sp. ANA-3]ABK49286.1 glutamyl peptidase. Serine peptidase. MEROPS family S09D [Shewanella sp. ANA-3]